MAALADIPLPLEAIGLAKRFGPGRGVEDVSLSVPCGSVTAFIGANGAGKSTTLRCILGLIRPDAGRVSLFGGPATKKSRRLVGFLPEERGLAPRDRVRDVIAFHARLKGLGRKEALDAADALLRRVGLAERARDQVGSLSKGNAQRVQLLCAIAHAPKLLILDEPLSGLDPIAQGDVLALFSEFRADGGAILFSTHSMATAEALSDRVVMLANGRTVFEGSLADAAGRAPHGAIVVTSDGESLLLAARAVGGDAHPMASDISCREGEAVRWRVVLPANVTHPALLRALAEHSAPILAFTPIRSDLEGAFWDLTSASRTAPNPHRRAA
jgi:ABC-2 type transport system ATP-binding protein